MSWTDTKSTYQLQSFSKYGADFTVNLGGNSLDSSTPRHTATNEQLDLIVSLSNRCFLPNGTFADALYVVAQDLAVIIVSRVTQLAAEHWNEPVALRSRALSKSFSSNTLRKLGGIFALAQA